MTEPHPSEIRKHGYVTWNPLAKIDGPIFDIDVIRPVVGYPYPEKGEDSYVVELFGKIEVVKLHDGRKEALQAALEEVDAEIERLNERRYQILELQKGD